MHVQDLVKNIISAIDLKNKHPYQAYTIWNDEYFSIRELVKRIESTLDLSIDCDWGARNYSGHEMLSIWPRAFERLPHLSTNWSFEAGILEIWQDIFEPS